MPQASQVLFLVSLCSTLPYSDVSNTNSTKQVPRNVTYFKISCRNRNFRVDLSVSPAHGLNKRLTWLLQSPPQRTHTHIRHFVQLLSNLNMKNHPISSAELTVKDFNGDPNCSSDLATQTGCASLFQRALYRERKLKLNVCFPILIN